MSSPKMTRLCTVCEEPIPTKRLKVVPTAQQCVYCLTQAGDTLKLKRHDDYVGRDGEEVVSTYYKQPTPYIKRHTERLQWAMSSKEDLRYDDD